MKINFFIVCFIGSSMINYGCLELWSDNGWYLVCDENFDDIDVIVVCKVLGYIVGLL